MKYNIFLFLFINIIYRLKCYEILCEEQNLYLNLHVIEKNETCFFAFDKDSFGNFYIIRENQNIQQINSLNPKTGLLFTSNVYLFKADFYINYNYFIYASYQDSETSNYKLKLILFDIEHFDNFNKEFLIQNSSNIQTFDVFYASNKNHFVFFGNKVYKYLIDFTLKEKTYNSNKKFSINKVSVQKEKNINEIILFKNSQSIIGINYNNNLYL